MVAISLNICGSAGKYFRFCLLKSLLIDSTVPVSSKSCGERLSAAKSNSVFIPSAFLAVDFISHLNLSSGRCLIRGYCVG